MHDFFMRRCLQLAEQARGKTGINPMVGAVLVRDGKIIAEGFHEGFGASHAEASLIKKFDQSFQPTDILYVNLEPCCHIDKKTPPCAQALIKRGLRHLVYGMKDPNPAVSGKGIDLLRGNGIEVIGSVLPAECMRLNRGFVSLMTKQRPWITLKKARTPDGRVSKPDGSHLKITSTEQDAWSHEFLRAKHDAILVGVGTVLSDDPELTVRSPERGGSENRAQPYRIIFDSTLQIPLTAKVVSDSGVSRTIIVHGSDVGSEKKSALRGRGVRLIECSMVGEVFGWKSLWKHLTTPHDDFYGISSILVEGGKRTWESFRHTGIVDEEITLIGN